MMQGLKKILLPDKVAGILKRLNAAGYEAWAVGGCVRDSLIGRVPGDWDITTSATPQEIKAVFRRTVDTGIAHGTVTVMLGDNGFEVTTYRLDGGYSDGRHPDSVSFSKTLAEDLKRRDFTINAMAYHPELGLVDLFGGQEDLAAGVIRAVGDPMARFEEDALRILRALRFSAQLGFTVEENSFAALSHFAPRLKLVSQERIREEFVKLLVSPHPEKLDELRRCSITAVIFPQWDVLTDTPQNTPYHDITVGEHTLRALRLVEAAPVLRLAVLLHDIGKPACRQTDAEGVDHFTGHAAVSAEMAEAFLRELKFDNDTIRRVCLLIREHCACFVPDAVTLRHMLARIGEEAFPDYLKLLEADNRAKSDLAWQDFSPRFDALLKCYREWQDRRDCISLKELAVKGKDLMAAGVKPGPELGRQLNILLEDVLNEPAHNTKEYLLGLLEGRG